MRCLFTPQTLKWIIRSKMINQSENVLPGYIAKLSKTLKYLNIFSFIRQKNQKDVFIRIDQLFYFFIFTDSEKSSEKIDKNSYFNYAFRPGG